MQGVNVPYKDLETTLKALKLQIIDSLDFADRFLPHTIKTPEDLFYFLRDHIKYKKDPSGVEYIQQFETLINSGAGDCDCMTVASIASFEILNFKPYNIVLVSNNPFNPTHIYSEVYDRKRGELVPFDLTNPKYGMERKYKYKQRLKIKL